MAFQPLSVGDILMLSQTAWKIGRAFTQGKKSAPSEFLEVERESNGLSEALKLVAETLHSDDGILSQADDDTKAAVNTIMDSARRTLDDLESFVERYQVIRKKETNGGFVVERGWTEVVLANYKTFKWTTEGGTIVELRNVLNMHTNTINLTMQALQSRSLSRLEKTVMPMADHVANIHDRVNGDLGDKIDDLHRLIMAVANSTPSLVAKDRAIENGSARGSVSTIESSGSNGNRLLEAPPPRSSSHFLPNRLSDRRESGQSSYSAANHRSGRKDSTYYSMAPLPPDKDSKYVDLGYESASPPSLQNKNGSLPSSPRSKTNSLSPDLYARSENSRRESTTLPNLYFDEESEDLDGPEASDSQTPPPELSPRSATSSFHFDANASPVLPPPAIPSKSNSWKSAATPRSIFGSQKQEMSDNFTRLSISSSTQTVKPAPKAKVDSPQSNGGFDSPNFEKSLFRNAAILCDVRATLVEYAQKNPDEPDPRFDVEMVPAMTEGRICVIRKREHREHSGTKVVTSIWSLSDDNEVRMQQKLSEVLETVPYCSFFQPEKVSLPATEGDIALKFHDRGWGDQLREEKKTNWINYVFQSEDDATSFQSAVFGRMLVGSYRTNKSTVIHGNGIRGALAFEEQFANIEMLRLWKDDGITLPGASGGVMALMHVSSTFGEGWARWWMNNSAQPVRVKEDGARHAKIKGLDMIVVRPGQAAAASAAPPPDNLRRRPTGDSDGLQRVDTATEIYRSPGKRMPVKRVTGIRVEFKTEFEKTEFVGISKILQQQMLPLPDL